MSSNRVLGVFAAYCFSFLFFSCFLCEIAANWTALGPSVCWFCFGGQCMCLGCPSKMVTTLQAHLYSYLAHYSPNSPHHLNTIIKIKWHVQPIWHTCSLFLYCHCTCMMCTCLEKASAKLYVRTKRFSDSGNRTRHLKWWYLGVTNWANASEVLAPE